MFGRALAASREAEFRISRPYDELSALRGESPPGAADFLRQRLRKFEEYFGVKTHDDIQASLEVLNPAETAALLRVCRRGVLERRQALRREQHVPGVPPGWLSTDRPRSGTTAAASTRAEPPPGLGLEYMRRRAGEVGADLDVISTPGRGTAVQVRFRKRRITPDPWQNN